MATFIIESNGRIERTAVYYNGEQIGGLKEVMLNIDEEGTFDAVLQYEGTNGEIYTKSIFEEFLENLKIVEATFTEEEAQMLTQFVVDSDGNIDNTNLFLNDEPLDGVVSIFIHIKSLKAKGVGIAGIFKKDITTDVEFRSEITFRNEDDTLETERIF